MTRTASAAKPAEPHWASKLHFANDPMPRTSLFWIVTDEGEAVEVRFDDEADHYSRQDGETGCWDEEQILGWTWAGEIAQEAAALLMAGVGQ